MKKKFAVIGVVLAAIVLLVTAGGYGAVRSFLGRIERIETEEIEVIRPEDEDFETEPPAESSQIPEPEETAPVTETPVVEQPEEEIPPVEEIEWEDIEALNDDELINIMLVGQDLHKGEPRGRTDSMLLFSLNPDTNQVALVSFMRDTYVQMPEGYSDNRLNTPYRFGGFPMLYETLEKNFGITIDGGVEIDYDGFERIIDLLGGVDVELSEREAAGFNGEIKSNAIMKRHAVPGWNHLDGYDTLQYARQRFVDSDYARTRRQRTVAVALMEKFRSADLRTLLRLADEALGMVRTDMSDEDIWNLVVKSAPMLRDVEISTHRIPADDAHYMSKRRGMSVLIPDLEMIREDLETEYLPLS